MIIHSRKRSSIVAGKQKVENKKPEKKARPKKVVKKEEEPILPLVEEALASVEE